MKESLLYKKLPRENTECETCAHYCVLRPGQRGLCGVRENVDGRLYFLPYETVVTRAVDPMRKKPLYHFMPGTVTYSLATVGCNFRCQNCQNFTISQSPKNPDLPREQIADFGEKVSPRDIINEAKAFGCPSISYTYTEPTVFMELALDIMKLAREEKLKNVWISNGFLSPESRKKIKKYIDAINIDIKSFNDKFYKESCGGRLAPVLENCQELKKEGIWLEITTLIIPGLNDSREELKQIAHFIADKLGAETPWHISRFSPEISWQLKNVRTTPIKKLKEAYEIGKSAGLMYVYIGNVPGAKFQDTFCPKCKTKNIDRSGFRAHRLDKKGKCHNCGFDLNIHD